MLEKYGLYILIAGSLVAAIGWLWLLIRAFGTSQKWGFLSLIFGFPGVLYALIYRQRGMMPMLVVLIGLAMAFVPSVWNYFFPPPIQDTAQKEQKNEGDIPKSPAFSGITGSRITLTGAKKEDYAELAKDKTFTVIQWANLDVDDNDAAVLAEMKNLKEIDLNNSQITDKTAKILQELKTLEIIRISNTKISAEEAQKLLDLPNLREIDVRKLKVPTKALQEWKAKDKDKRKYLN